MALGEGNKVVFLKNKVSFQAYAVLMYFLVASLFFVFVAAQAETGCCEDAGNENYCTPTTQDNCLPESQWTPVTCNQVSYCATGCCVSKDDGSCGQNVPEANCEANGDSVFYKEKSCEQVSVCQSGCCQLGTEFIYNTKGECQSLLSDYYPSMNANEAWDPSVEDEYSCLLKSMEDDLGCCVAEEEFSVFGSCSWTNSGSCSTSGQENLDEGGSGFYSGIFCSNENLPCACEPQDYKACSGEQDEDVYWFDSCGNREELADDCDPFSDDGSETLCKENGEDASCQSVDCVDTVDIPNNPHDQGMGGYREFGESWCSYESGSGGFLDRPGSRQYRHVCINGEELIEECKDFREEICLQADMKPNEIGGSFATCKSLDEFPKIDLQKYFKTKDVNKSLVYPSEAGFNDEEKKLVSITGVAEGGKFWSEEGEIEIENQCAKGKSTCTVVYSKKNYLDDWECVANCFCETKQYLENANNYCKAFGDCGADLNILEEFSDEGLAVKWKGISEGPKPKKLPDNYAEKLNVYGLFGGMSKIKTSLEDSDEAKDEAELLNATYGFYYSFGYGVIFDALGLDFIFDIADSLIGWMLEDLGFISEILSEIGEFLSWTFGGDVAEKTVIAKCEPWIPPSGGDNCEKCTDDPRYANENYENPVVCSEYRCKSLGLACQLVNEGTLEQDCIANNPNDVTPPVITPWNEIINLQTNSKGEQYQVDVLASGKGYAITPEIDPLTLFTFGIRTSEPARCRWDNINTGTFEEMTNEFEEGVAYVKEHNFTWGFDAGENHELYVRCVDYYNNGKDAPPYLIQFNVAKIPDFKAPFIFDYALPEGVVTSYSNGNGEGAIKAGVNETALVLYMDEPVETCRWSTESVPFAQMSTNNSFFCGCYSSTSSACTGTSPAEGAELCEYFDENGALLTNQFECIGTINGIKQDQQNAYYISCVDVKKEYGGGCNIGQPPKLFTIESTGKLNIVSAEPENGTYYYPDFVLRAVTSGGAENGKAFCSYDDGSYGYIEFFETGGTVHTQHQNRTAGDYLYTITCEDAVGNEAQTQMDIAIDVDSSNPLIDNIYSQGGVLHVITSEAATCEYSTEDPYFDIGDGFEMVGKMVKQHSLMFVDEVYYIKCYDIFGNEGGSITVYKTE